MVEAEALHRVGDWPFLQLGSQGPAEFEVERARAGLLDRPRDPKVMIQSAEQGLASIFAVEQLESRYALAWRSSVVRDLLELCAMVDGERHDRRRLRPAGRRPIDVAGRLVAAQGAMPRAVLEKQAELGPDRIFG